MRTLVVAGPLAVVALLLTTIAAPDVHWAIAVLAVFVTATLTTRRREARAPVAAVLPATDMVHELRSLVALVPSGVVLVDEHETVLVANPAAASILRRPPEAMEGVTLIRATRDAALVQVLREAAGTPREVALSDDRLVRAAAARLDAPPVHAVLTVQDLTALRNAERARSELVANVSHELRTPIAAARALAETLEGGVEEDDQRERFHARLTRELERLGEIVERLLRLSRLESRHEEFDVHAVDAHELTTVALTRMGPVADRAGVRLASSTEAGSGAVLADRERALEVLTNLLDNAIRYSPAGATVTVEVAAVEQMVRFSVRDEGPGILPSDRQRVFERFYTVDRSRGGDDTGTGLGLSIARHIVSRLGGEIWVADTAPGAMLSFTLPRIEAVPDSAPEPATEAEELAGEPST